MDEYEQAIPLDDVNDEIKDWLFDMEEFGYDFRFINLDSLENDP